MVSQNLINRQNKNMGKDDFHIDEKPSNKGNQMLRPMNHSRALSDSKSQNQSAKNDTLNINKKAQIPEIKQIPQRNINNFSNKQKNADYTYVPPQKRPSRDD